MGFSLMNMSHLVKCTYGTRGMLLLYTQALCQYKLRKADHASLTYLMLQR
jgi:hypothetical protein